MKHRAYILALLLGLLATGCVHNDIDNPNLNGNEVRLWGGITRTPGVRYASAPTSKGTSTSTSGILDPAWNGELNIGVARVSKKEDSDLFPDFRNLGDPLAATLGLPDPSNSYYRPISFKTQAQFFPDDKNELRYVAWYPWNESDYGTPNVDDDGSTYVSDVLKTAVTIDITGDKDVLYGNVIELKQKESFPIMEFDHALCLYRIYAYAMVGGVDMEGNPILTSDYWGKIDQLTLEDLPQQVELILPHGCLDVGSGHETSAELFTINYNGNQNIDLHDEGNNIFFDAPEQLPIGIADAVLVSKCIAAPPKSGVMSIAVKTNTQSALQEVSIARNFQPGHAYDIILRFSDHGLINADVSVSDWTTYGEDVNQDFGAHMYFDLSSYETANCYEISSANYSYCFNCTVKGNGVGDLLGLDAADMALDPGWIDIIWEDLPTFDHDGDSSTPEIESVVLQSNHPAEGKVLFDVFGYEDNDNKELPVEGNALIGAYDKDPSEGGKLLWTWHIWVTDKPQGLGCSGGYVIMDRNIGATSAVPVGGENDPARGLYYQWGRPVPLKIDGLQTNSDLLTLENFHPSNNPNTLYGSGSAEGGWLSEESKIFEQHDHMWGDTSVAFETPRKTLLDPCPPGYFVTPHMFWQGIERYEEVGGFQAGVGVRLNMSSNTFWLPSQGIINDDGVVITGDGTALRTSTINRENGGGGGGEHHHTPYYLTYTASKTASVSSTDSHGNYAIAVRCISEATDPVVIDLSQSQTANSYMVNGPGYYKFKANVRGNGVKELWPYGGTQMLDISDGMDVNITPDKVDLLWWQGDFSEMAATPDEDEIEKLMCVNIEFDGALNKEGYAMFRIRNFHPGNAIVAAYDAKGDILWTWHLWLTASKPKDINSAKRTLQDRALGATQAPIIEGSSITFVDYANNQYDGDAVPDEVLRTTYGFYYQWGRKDPILGAPLGASGDESVAGNVLTTSPYWIKDYSTGTWERRESIACDSQVSITKSVAFPMTFYKSTNDGGGTDSQWFSPSFADGKRNVALWGYAVENSGVAGKDFSKTMYDPCPPGYRTPFHDMWWFDGSNMYAGADNNATETITWALGEGDFCDYGFVTHKHLFDDAWFPYAGTRNATTGGYVYLGTYGYLHSGFPMGQYNTRTFQYGNGQSVQNTGAGSAFGRMVRCMKE